MYGENSGRLRDALASLLRQHRILQRLGGPGMHTVPESTTPEERQAMGEQIQGYRHAVLVWCLQAVRAVTPAASLYAAATRPREPVDELRYRLMRTIEGSASGLPRLADLTTAHDHAMVETWRQAARVAALGEHDFGAGVGRGKLSEAECRAVAKDAADIVRGLVKLDERYANIPGWHFLKDRGWLARAAEVCSNSGASEERDYSVDERGWRPAAGVIEGPALAGISGVIQAQHNLVIALGDFPDVLNLRRIIHTQAEVSHEAARHAPDVAPELIEGFLDREQTYKILLRETRDIDGRIGSGGIAAAEAANALGRLRRVPVSDTGVPHSLKDLSRLFTRTDARIAMTIQQGLQEKLYFIRAQLPELVDQPIYGISRVREQWVPYESPVQTDLIGIIRDRLRPPPDPSRAPANCDGTRREFEAALNHRPERRTAPHR